MREVASHVAGWLREGREVALARVMTIDGFGGRTAGEAWAFTADKPSAGDLLSGSADEELKEAANDLIEGRKGARIVTIPVGDADAVAAGLACGGVAHVLVQRAVLVPPEAWEAMAVREPVAVATLTDGAHAGRSLAVRLDDNEPIVSGSTGSDALDTVVVQTAVDYLRKGKEPVHVLDTDDGRVLVEIEVPAPHMVVVGAAHLATAIDLQGRLLGWSTAIVDEHGSGGAELSVSTAAALGSVDALVVLSHDLPASCGALAAALKGRCGFVGALGSRHTQSVRTEYLREQHGLDEASLSRVHGPVGLDLGSRTPAETALAIFAEILASRSGRSAASLRATAGPING